MAEIFLSGSEDQLSKSAVRGDTSGEQRNSPKKKEGYIVVGIRRIAQAYVKQGSNTSGDLGGAWQP